MDNVFYVQSESQYARLVKLLLQLPNAIDNRVIIGQSSAADQSVV